MPKISNQTIYPPDTAISPDDYLIGTDYENANQTKTFPVVDLATAVGDILGLTNTNTVLVSVGSIEVVGDEITLNDVVYKISGQEFTINSQSFTVTPATDGFYRNDIIYGTNAGILEYLEGEESETSPVQPVTPFQTVLVTVVNVFGANIIPVIPPSGDTMLKSEEGQFPIYITGTSDVLGWEGKNTYRFLGDSALNVGSLSTTNAPGYLYDGRPFTFINNSASNLTLRHLYSLGEIKFFMPNLANLLVPPGYAAVFKYTAMLDRLELMSFSNISVVSISDRRYLYTASSDTDTFIITDLIAATAIQMIASNVSGNVMGSAITFNSVTGEISGYPVLTGEEHLIYYTKP